MSAELPLTEWRSRAPHDADDCPLERCSYCGCCEHGKPVAAGCKVETAPAGMTCPDHYCDCEGKS
jgi:hypothetical protein